MKQQTQYAQLVLAVSNENFSFLEDLETDTTKCGFCPVEEGKGCVKRMLQSNQNCKDEILFALKQGYAITEFDNAAGCVSPPQLADSNVVYEGPRVHLVFGAGDRRAALGSTVCGGDQVRCRFTLSP